jgi:arylsulfatase A-like enzyme
MRSQRTRSMVATLLVILGVALVGTPTAQAQEKKPNIVVIMGDDVGIWNIGAYHRGMMAGRTPHLDKLAAEGMLFTDYYAEASCTAGRAAFITGELPIRTGMTTVGQAGASVGMPAQACTIATALKELGYATGHGRAEEAHSNLRYLDHPALRRGGGYWDRGPSRPE